MKTLSKIKNTFKKFHNDEAGLEALQIVMIIAIAALVLIAIKNKWPEVRDWMNEQVDGIMEFES